MSYRIASLFPYQCKVTSHKLHARWPVTSYTTAWQYSLNWDFLAQWLTQQNVDCLTSCSCRQPCWSSDTSQCQRCSPHEESDLPQMHQVHHYQNTAVHEADCYSNRQYAYSCECMDTNTHTCMHTHTHTCKQTHTHTHSLWSSSQTIIVSRVYIPLYIIINAPVSLQLTSHTENYTL